MVVQSNTEKIQIPTFVKWAGGKTQLISQYKPLFPKQVKRYFEPFLGSGAVFFYLKQKFPLMEAHLSDVSKELINCYSMVRGRRPTLIELLKQHKALHSKNYYYKVRALDKKSLTNVSRASRLIYLNKTCFNGLYRVNSKGQFNVPIGDYKNPGIVREETLNLASKLLRGAKISAGKFEDIATKARKGDFIYFDPPYMPLSKTSNFTSYTKNSFDLEDQTRLAELFKRLDKKGCKLMLSNSNLPIMRELYKGYDIRTVNARRLISCDPNGRGHIKEVVVRNY
ncbi:DNA adenine methylase [Candidatus Undinarchaeota archaeon]